MDTLPYKSKLLIIHQDPTLQSLMISMLETMGYAIETAPDTESAVKNLEEAPADLLLAEADLADADGLEAILGLKRKFGNVPVIMLVTDDHPALARQAVRRGAASVLRFPTSTIQFRAAVSHEAPPPKPIVAPTAARLMPMSPLSTFRTQELGLSGLTKERDPVAMMDARHRAGREEPATAEPKPSERPATSRVYEPSSRLSVAARRLRWDDNPPARATPVIGPLKIALEEPERRIILEALEAFQWNRQETARVLEIDRTTLYKKIKKYKLEESLSR